MNKNNIAVAEAFYTAMGQRNITEMGKFLHSDAQWISPLGTLVGREALLGATETVFPILNTVTIRAKSCSEDQVMIAFDIGFDDTIGVLQLAALLMIRDGLIVNVETFFDTRFFYKK